MKPTISAKLANLESVTCHDDEPPMSATALVDTMELHIPLAGFINKEAELARLDKELEKLRKEAVAGMVNSAMKKFIAKAPETVVQKEQKSYIANQAL